MEFPEIPHLVKLSSCRQLMWKKEFDTSYVGFMEDGAQWLVDNTDIKLVGEFEVAMHPFEVPSLYL
jgi:kynurenine formamidase